MTVGVEKYGPNVMTVGVEKYGLNGQNFLALKNFKYLTTL
jgi:hypothetical protein